LFLALYKYVYFILLFIFGEYLKAEINYPWLQLANKIYLTGEQVSFVKKNFVM
jgi:hypothetical protein